MEGNDSSLIACMYMHIHACIPIACTCGALLPINDEIRDSCSFKLVSLMEPKAMKRTLALATLLFLLVSPSLANYNSCYLRCFAICHFPQFMCKLGCSIRCSIGRNIFDYGCSADCIKSTCLHLKQGKQGR